MATYIVTLPDGESHNADLAPDAFGVLVALALGLKGEDVRMHCMYHHSEPITGDDVCHHSRLGLTVRRLP